MEDEKRKEVVGAFNIIKQVCEGAQGDFRFHNTVQGALALVAETLYEFMGKEEIKEVSEEK